MAMFPATMALLGSVFSPAAAAPRFVGDAEDVALAAAAWEGAVACTGREGLATELVPIVRRSVPGDYLGVARTEPESGRLYRIDLNAEASRHREVVVHEVTHAWVSEGPVALVEGTAELIADCIVTRHPSLAPLQYDDGSTLSGLPDLVGWSKPTEGTPSELHAVRTDAYVGAARLLRTAARVVPPERLWASRTLDWATFDALLAGAGPQGDALARALHDGARAQRIALSDADRDGLTAIAEGWSGTDDGRFDTDDDGWWDGGRAGAPADAVAVPADGTPVCTGHAAGTGAGTLVAGGNLRGATLPEVLLRRPGGDGVRPLLVAFGEMPGTRTTGSAWARVDGGTEAAAGCLSTASTTVWAEDPAFAGLVPELSRRLERAAAIATERYGPGPQRIALALGGARSTVEDEVVWLSTTDVARALARGDADGLALLAVSLRRLWVAGERDWTAAEAVARSLAPSP